MFNNDDNMVMPVAPTGFMGNNGGLGNILGGDGLLLILFFLIFGNNGWGNNQNANQPNGNTLYPWLNQSEQINNGFRDQNMQNGINDISNQICNSTASINATANQNAFNLQSAMTNNAFNSVTAMNNGFNSLSSQFAQCCCDNRLASADLKATLLQENCADRYEAANNTRDIIENDNRNHQAVMDKLCQLELDGVRNQAALQKEADNNTIAQLRAQIDAMNTTAAVNSAVGRVLADNAAQTQILNPTPIPAYQVPAPYNCGCYNNCGC